MKPTKYESLRLAVDDVLEPTDAEWEQIEEWVEAHQEPWSI